MTSNEERAKLEQAASVYVTVALERLTRESFFLQYVRHVGELPSAASLTLKPYAYTHGLTRREVFEQLDDVLSQELTIKQRGRYVTVTWPTKRQKPEPEP